MPTKPQTGLVTPAENADPFFADFESYSDGLDGWDYANAADLNLAIRCDTYQDLPRFDDATGQVYWGNIRFFSPRYGSDIRVTPNTLAISEGQCLYLTAPARPFTGATVPLSVGSMPRTDLNEVAIGALVNGEFHLLANVAPEKLGAGPAPQSRRKVDTAPYTARNSDKGWLLTVTQGQTLTLPTPNSLLNFYFLKCDGSPSQYFTLRGGLGALGWLGPHEREYSWSTGDLRIYGGGGFVMVAAHEPVAQSGNYGWLLASGTGKIEHASTGEVWYLDGGNGESGATFPRTVIVEHGANALANGTNLIAAYAAAKTMSPTAASRVTVIVPPGEYDLAGASLAVDTDYIDIQGYGNARRDSEDGSFTYPSSYIHGSQAGNVIDVTAREANYRGLRVENNGAGQAVIIDNPNNGDRLAFEDIYAASATGGIGIGATGTTKRLDCYFKNCHSPQSMIRCQEFRGTARDCSGGDYSFCAYLGDTTKVECNGYFWDCYAIDQSFGYNDSGDAEASGRFDRCNARDFCFGSSEGGTVYYGEFSGRAFNCNAGHRSYGAGGGTTAGHVFSGEAADCRGGENCFGGGTIGLVALNSILMRCIARARSYGCGGMTGNILNCISQFMDANLLVQSPGQIIDSFFAAATASIDNDGGYLRNCLIQTINASPPVLITNSSPNNPRVEKCTLHAYAAPNCIGGTGTGLIIFNSMNTPIAGTVTNSEATPYNIVNASVFIG